MISHLETPLGWLEITTTQNGLAELKFLPTAPSRIQFPSGYGQEVADQLIAYFQGHRRQFQLQLALVGTEFQQQVWSVLTSIPFGQTKTYGQLAEVINNVKACRAVGAANGRNPVLIIVPCHRVVAAGGQLGGYSAGLNRKKWLLQHEGVTWS